MHSWPIHEAKARLSELVKQAQKQPQQLTSGARQRALRTWLEQELPAFFAGRLLPIEEGVAHRWGHLMAKVGRPLPAIDSLLAATAQEHKLVLITRNLKDVAEGRTGSAGGLEGLQFGLDIGFREAHGLEESDVVAPHGLGVGVIQTQALPEDDKCTAHQRLRLRQAVGGLQQRSQVVELNAHLGMVLPVAALFDCKTTAQPALTLLQP